MREIYDVGIVGGGIAGASVARDASLRGLRTVLFEKNTIGSGTSSRSSKLIHGGIRYLESAWNALIRWDLREFWTNLRFVFSSLRESKIIDVIAPAHVKLIPIVVPVYQSDKRGLFEIYIGSLIYFVLACLAGRSKFPKLLPSPTKVLRVLPGLNPAGLKGGVVIWDYLTDDLKLVEAIAASAKKSGAQIRKNSRVSSLEYDDKTGLYEITFEENGKLSNLSVRKLVNTAGPWIDKIRNLFGERRLKNVIFPIAGSHITTHKFIPASCLLQSRDGRFFFVINTGRFSRTGTTERLHRDPDTVKATDKEVRYLLNSLEHYFPKKHPKMGDIIQKDAGIRPLTRPRRRVKKSDISREHRILKDPHGMLSVVGVKLTDHRRAAEKTVNLIAKDLKNHSKCQTAKQPL